MTSVWGATSTTDEVLSGTDLRGKRVLVTGVSAGIGVETARALAAHGAQVTGAVRAIEKAKAVTAQVRKDAAANGSSFEPVAPNFERTAYDPFLAYGRSKTANILFAVALDQRHRGRRVRPAAVHPGGIRTELGRHMDSAQLKKMVDQMNQQLAAEGKATFRLCGPGR